MSRIVYMQRVIKNKIKKVFYNDQLFAGKVILVMNMYETIAYFTESDK